MKIGTTVTTDNGELKECVKSSDGGAGAEGGGPARSAEGAGDDGTDAAGARSKGAGAFATSPATELATDPLSAGITFAVGRGFLGGRAFALGGAAGIAGGGRCGFAPDELAPDSSVSTDPDVEVGGSS